MKKSHLVHNFFFIFQSDCILSNLYATVHVHEHGLCDNFLWVLTVGCFVSLLVWISLVNVHVRD